MKKGHYFLVLTLTILMMFLTGCTLQQNDIVSPEIMKKDPSSKEKEKKIEKVTPTPLQLENGEQFEGIYGWLDDQTILYGYVHEKEYLLATYQLYEGEAKVIFTSKYPFNDVTIHNDKELLLIHTSNNSHSADLYFTDLEGGIKFSTSIESYEIAIEWNKDNSNLLLLTAFFEDWSYENMLIDVHDQAVSKMSETAPFSKWFGEADILSQEWDLEKPNVLAPLVKQSLSNPHNKETLLDQVYRYDAFSDVLMTIHVKNLEAEEMEYSFYNASMQKVRPSIKVPNLTQYADWLIPYYDFSVAKNSFLTFVPKHHGSVDTYTEGFNLIAYDLSNEKNEVILENMENKPISCSPNGKSCLYGYQLEEFINLETRDRVDLSPLTIGSDNGKLITVT